MRYASTTVVSPRETILISGASRLEAIYDAALDCLEQALNVPRAAILLFDADGVMRGFIHFVPSYGRPAMSLSLMRRDRETPNGLMEYLVVHSIEALKERGVCSVICDLRALPATGM